MSTNCTLRALYDYVPERDDELPLVKGKLYTGISREDGWWKGYPKEGPKEAAIFPSNYVEVVQPPTPTKATEPPKRSKRAVRLEQMKRQSIFAPPDATTKVRNPLTIDSSAATNGDQSNGSTRKRKGNGGAVKSIDGPRGQSSVEAKQASDDAKKHQKLTRRSQQSHTLRYSVWAHNLASISAVCLLVFSPIAMIWGTECLSNTLAEGDLGVLVVNGVPRVRVNSPLARAAAVAAGTGPSSFVLCSMFYVLFLFCSPPCLNPMLLLLHLCPCSILSCDPCSGVDPANMVDTVSACNGESDYWIGLIGFFSSLFILFVFEPFFGNRRSTKTGKFPNCIISSSTSGAGNEALNVTFPWRGVFYLVLGCACVGTVPTVVPGFGLLVASIAHFIAARYGEHGNANPPPPRSKTKKETVRPWCGWYFPTILRCGLCGSAKGLWDARGQTTYGDDEDSNCCDPVISWCQVEFTEKMNIGKWLILSVYVAVNVILFSARFDEMVHSGALVNDSVLVSTGHVVFDTVQCS